MSNKEKPIRIISISAIGTDIFGLGDDNIVYEYGSITGEWKRR